MVYLLRFTDRRLNELVGLAAGFHLRLADIDLHDGAHAAEFTSAFQIHGEITVRVRRTHVNHFDFRSGKPATRIGEVEHYSA